MAQRSLMGSLCISLLMAVDGYTQVPETEWDKSLGGTDQDYGTDIAKTPDGGYIMTGYSYSNDGDVDGHNGYQDYWVVKTNALAEIEWQVALGGTGIDRAQSVNPTSDGGYVVAGFANSSDGMLTEAHGMHDFWIVKLDGDGQPEWQRAVGSSGQDMAYCVQEAQDGGYIAIGTTEMMDGDVTGNNGSSDVWVVKLDANGMLEWEQNYGGGGMDEGFYITPLENGDYVAIGTTSSIDGDISENNGFRDYWVIRLDANGTLLWEKTYGGTMQEIEARTILETSDHGFIFGGSSESDDSLVTGAHGDYDFWVVKTDSLGEVEWERAYGGSAADYLNDLIQTDDGGYLLIGDTKSDDGDVTGLLVASWDTFEDYWVVKLSAEGEIQWQKTLGSHFGDYSGGLVQANDHGYVVMGGAMSINAAMEGDFGNGNGGVDYGILKFAPDGLQTALMKGNDFRVFPNPSNGIIAIEGQPDGTSVIITGIGGNFIGNFTLTHGEIDLLSLSSGMYLLWMDGTGDPIRFIIE